MEYMTDKEIDELMEKINSDPELKNATPPADMYDKVMASIREHEEYKKADKFLKYIFED